MMVIIGIPKIDAQPATQLLSIVGNALQLNAINVKAAIDLNT